MLGAIAGDIFCSSYEFDPEPHESVDLFERHRFFTDDTVLTIATADALLTDGDYTRAYREWGRRSTSRSPMTTRRPEDEPEIVGPASPPASQPSMPARPR
jgi:ADP-ribosylglycohydrolase